MLRLLHTNVNLRTVSKSGLAKLRKKTGYTFANCRKALELHENDVGKAEVWLKEQAKVLGWEKASKLEGRPTVQGLVGVGISQNRATMVEVNCETDFVARNGKFRSLVETVTATCLNYPTPSDQQINKVNLNSEQLKSLASSDGRSLADQVALIIGSVGENISLRRAICYKTSPSILLSAFTHPAVTEVSTLYLGKYGSIVAYTKDEASLLKGNSDEVGRQLCQHIIGMNPERIGVVGEDEPLENAEEESVMVNQEYLLDPSLTVGQLMQEAGVTVLDFKRFECGEADNTEVAEVTQKLRAEG